AWGCTGNQCDIASEFAVEFFARCGSNSLQGLGRGGLRVRTSGGSGVFRPPFRLLGDGLSGSLETLDWQVDLTECHAGEVFASGSPAVIEKHCALGVKGWGNGLFPTGTQLGLDGLEQGVIGLRGLRSFFDQAQLRQHLASSSSEDTVFTGDDISIGIQGCGVDDSTAAGATCSTHGHRGAVCCGYGLD